MVLEDVAATLREHDQRAVVADGRDGLDEPRVSEVPQIAPVRVERTVLAVAEIAGRHDAEGADGGERANLRAAQPHVAVSRPDTLAFRASRQLEVAREHIARVERLALARIGQPSAAALAQLATLLRQGFGAQAVVVAVAWVIVPARIKVHRALLSTYAGYKVSPPGLQNSGGFWRIGAYARERIVVG